MHNLPQTFNNENQHNWNGPLTQGIDLIINKFLTDIHQPDGEQPMHSMLIAPLNTNQGGLGLLNTSHKATPNFVISIWLVDDVSFKAFKFTKTQNQSISITPLLTSLTVTITPPQIASHDTFNSSLTLHVSVIPQTAPKMNTSKFLNRKFPNIAQEADSNTLWQHPYRTTIQPDGNPSTRTPKPSSKHSFPTKIIPSCWHELIKCTTPTTWLDHPSSSA